MLIFKISQKYDGFFISCNMWIMLVAFVFAPVYLLFMKEEYLNHQQLLQQANVPNPQQILRGLYSKFGHYPATELEKIII